MGMTLIEIPYWWDHETSSLRATLHHYRPDLMPSPGNGQAIDSTVPQRYTTPRYKPLSTKNFTFMSTTKWNRTDPKGW
jgi:hypothetical protein